jgi:uncharacterized membrane protein YgaE (UPF0421/DUF939 family)
VTGPPADHHVLETTVRRGRLTVRERLARLRAARWPILQTALTATAAWLLAERLLGHDEPVFASIAAVVCVGATEGRRGRRSFELVGGVVLGITVGDLIVGLLGTGPAQLLLLVVLAMTAATVLRGGELAVTEAAVSAILIGTLERPEGGVEGARAFEAMVGGGLALVSNYLIFPPDPLLRANRAAQAVFSELGTALEAVARAIEGGDVDAAERSLFRARELDRHVVELDAVLADARDTARFSLARRSARPRLELFSRGAAHIDRAVRNVRVLARASVRHLRGGSPPMPALAEAVRDLARAVWALAAALDDPHEFGDARRFAIRASSRATEVLEEHGGLATNVIVGQVQSTAADLLRAASLEAGESGGPGSAEVATEELLARSPTTQAPPSSPAASSAPSDGSA